MPDAGLHFNFRAGHCDEGLSTVFRKLPDELFVGVNGGDFVRKKRPRPDLFVFHDAKIAAVGNFEIEIYARGDIRQGEQILDVEQIQERLRLGKFDFPIFAQFHAGKVSHAADEFPIAQRRAGADVFKFVDGRIITDETLLQPDDAERP